MSDRFPEIKRAPTNPKRLSMRHFGAACSLFAALTLLSYLITPSGSAALPSTIDKGFLAAHAVLVSLAVFAAGILRHRVAPAATALGLIYIAIWGVTEVSQQTFLQQTLGALCSPAHRAAAMVAGENIGLTPPSPFPIQSEFLLFVLSSSFAVGSLSWGFAFWSGDDPARPLACIWLLIGAMTLSALAIRSAGFHALAPAVKLWNCYLFGPSRIVQCLLLGFWLWPTGRPTPESDPQSPPLVKGPLRTSP
ncbi:hypothetical protein SCOR_33190 [Sulfidibacter corallicola]|uniref:Uncharacterized protein n=1 Tax=Sulfidibacter corallicola TaxID=2818388 RepID=A0A8A4TJE2_SULCO|nr:hypothetical protein [Sulfidibacter corallicola]QTD49607.1 hypothetical protein J3U87_28810 [Sulfidibacter corallicola]